MRRMCAFAVIALAVSAATVAEDRKATIGTMKGDVVEGTFRGATESSITLEIAGQPLQIPISNVRYLSFGGKIETSSPTTTTQPGSIDDAFKALDDLSAVLQVGILREQYGAKLVELLPRVNAFINTDGADWADVRSSLDGAVKTYSQPLGDAASWTAASDYFTIAGRYVAYARKLSSDPAERTHREAPADVHQVEIGKPFELRLGAGDKLLAEDVDREYADAYAHSYKFNISAPTKIEIQSTSVPAAHVALLYDATTGKRIARETGRTNEIRKTLQGGSYLLRLAASRPAVVSVNTQSLPR